MKIILPKELYEALLERANKEDTSIKALIVSMLMECIKK